MQCKSKESLLQVNSGISVHLKQQQQSKRDPEQFGAGGMGVGVGEGCYSGHENRDGPGEFQTFIATNSGLAQTLTRGIWIELISCLGSRGIATALS